MMNKVINDKNHQRKMVKRRAFQDTKIASKTVEKGLLMVHTGTGKGKSTAAFGLGLRMLGHGHKIGIVQFIKGAWDTGERKALEMFGDQVQWHSMGEGFTWETQDRQKDILAAGKAWDKAVELINDPTFELVILDEINIALRYNYLDLEKVLDILKSRRTNLHIMLTGRNAKSELIEVADMVIDMQAMKHHFASGVKAQKGIEF